MGRLKDKIYNFFVKKNWGVNLEYEPFIDTHKKSYGKCRLKRLWLLFRLNFHYRILRKKTPMLKATVDRLVKNSAKRASNIAKKQVLDKIKQEQIEAKKAQRYPYLSGSESERFKRKESIIFTKGRLLSRDVISFDIFDTLILRPFAKPLDLFFVVGNRLGIINFRKIRMDAEKEARATNELLKGTREVTIYEIYEIVSKVTGINIELGVKTEFEVEKDFCFANPYMKQVFNLLKDQGKDIIITSDMYYPHDMMTELLESCGYTGYKKLYVSCDYQCSKRSGGLYQNILNDFKDKTIVHVGDNKTTDLEKARSFGIEAVYYQNCHEKGNKYRAENMTKLIGSLYSGIVNTHLHNGTQFYSPYYEYGFVYGGLYVTGYCNWIYQRAKEQGVEKILFLARDGDIYQKVFNKMFDDMPNEYVYWSRIANLKYTAENCRLDFLIKLVRKKAHGAFLSDIGEVLRSFKLENLIPLLQDYSLDENLLLTDELIKTFENFLIENYNKIVESYKKESEQVEKYLKNIIGNSKKIAIVDVGWVGSGPLGIKWLVEQKWKMNCSVECYLAASTHSNVDYNANELLNGSVQTYIFSNIYNGDIYEHHKNAHNGTNNIYFELFSQSCEPSFSGVSKDGEFEFNVPETLNYEITQEIQKGILDFNKRYLHFAKNDKYLLNICGRDAYMPYKFITKSLKLLKNIFKDVTYSRGVSLDINSQKQETINDICKKQKL